MLTYVSYSNSSEASTAPCDTRPSEASVLLAAALDADAVTFFLRMTADIFTLASYIGRPLYRIAASESLGTALTASPMNRTRAWRRVYVRTSCLLARCTADASEETLRGDPANAFRRLRQFVRENADLGRA